MKMLNAIPFLVLAQIFAGPVYAQNEAPANQGQATSAPEQRTVGAGELVDERRKAQQARLNAQRTEDELTNCGSLRNAFGPHDYRRAARADIEIVENHHFTPNVEQLQSSPHGIVNDLDYTLRAIPNHHRALIAMSRLAERYKTDRPRGSRYSVSCWFQRAQRFAPDDTQVQSIYGAYLMKKGRTQDAITVLESAAKDEAMASNPQLNYNLGLAYFQMRQYDKAAEKARIAYSGGLTFPALRQKLKAVGKNVD